MAKRATEGMSHPVIAKRVKRAAGRSVSPSTVSRFLGGHITPDYLVTALHREFALPPPVFIPFDAEEALELWAVQQRCEERRRLELERRRTR